MLRTLKIARILAGLVTAGFIVYLLMSGLKPDAELVAVLEKQSAVDKFRQLTDLVNRNQDQKSAFVVEAKNFALRINPPKPPEPPKPAEPAKPAVTEAPKIERPTPVAPTRTTKFSLVATCRYEDQPDKSLALLDVVAEGQKWVRQGETIGHLTVNEVKDGSIVLFQNGQLNTEIFVPPVTPEKSLLANADTKAAAAEAPESKAAPVSYEPVVNRTVTSISNTRPSPVTSRVSNLRPTTTGSVPATRPVPAPRPMPTPEQQKKALEDNISQIQNIMSETAKSSKNSASADELKAWGDLLKALQSDKEKIEGEPPTPGSKTPEGDQRPSIPVKKTEPAAEEE